MKNLTKTILIAAGLAIAATAHSSSDVSGTYIGDIAISRSYGSFVFIHVASTPANRIACSTHSYWHYTLPLATASDRDLYAMLLTAYAGKASVELAGLGVCNEFSSAETLGSLRLTQ